MSTIHLTQQVADHVTLQHGPKYVFAFHAYCSGVHVLHLCRLQGNIIKAACKRLLWRTMEIFNIHKHGKCKPILSDMTIHRGAQLALSGSDVLGNFRVGSVQVQIKRP